MKILYKIALFSLIFTTSFAQTYYFVNGTLGADIPSNGLAPDQNAWKTIEYAVANVADPTVAEIVINISSGIYDLSNNQIDINRDFYSLTLIGAGKNNTFVQSSADTSTSTSRVIKVYTSNNLSIKDMTIRNGRGSNYGGGIFNEGGTLNIDACIISNNLCHLSGVGAGIGNYGGNITITNSTISYNIASETCYGGGVGSRDGNVDISNSTIAYNQAQGGGGIAIIAINSPSNFNITNSTISENTASFFCGGIRFSHWGTNPNITSTINSCTIFKNFSTGIKGIGGIGVLSPVEIHIKNSIIAGNVAGISNDISGTIISDDYNLIQDTSSVVILGTTDNNLYNISPECAELSDNNSLNGTQTCSIPINSPARDRIPSINPNGAPPLDQRGFNRVGDYDIGAYEYTGAADVKSNDNVPVSSNLDQNYPNPFNPSTKISYSVSQPGLVTLIIYNVLGTEIETLVNEEKPAGSYELTWNPVNLPSGIYFYRIQSGSFVETKKMILMK